MPAVDRPDPVALLQEQDATREPDLSRCGTAGCWSRPSPSTGRGQDHGCRPCRHPHRRPAGPAVRGCPSVQSSGPSPHPSGSCCSTSTTSTRPSQGRSSTTVRMAASFTVAPQQRLRQGRRWPPRGRRWRPTARRCRLHADGHDGHLVCPPGRGPGHGQHPQVSRDLEAQQGKEGEEGNQGGQAG